MEKKNIISSFDLIVPLILYTALAFFLIFSHHFHLGADGISYFSIALKYMNLDWSNAINAYWSPLYSWLMIPIICILNNSGSAEIITRIVSLIAGFFTIIGLYFLTNTFNLDKSVKSIILITAVPMLLFYSIFYDTPDVLVVCLLIFYFVIIFKENYSDKWINGALCGLIGALSFFSKTYIFLFFLVHFLFFNFLYYIKGVQINKNGVKRNLIIGLVVFLAISGLWIGTLYSKYDELTIGTTSEYNHAISGPEYQNHPVYFLGLIKPPNNSATSIWEEPSLIKLNDWSPFDSWEDLNFQVNLFEKNLFKVVVILEYYSLLSLAIIIISLYLILKTNTKKAFKTRLSYILITIFIYASGYLIIHIQERYIWPIILLIMFNGFYIINIMYKQRNIKLKTVNVLAVILMFSFIFAPAYELFAYPGMDNTFLLAKTLKNDYGIKGNIASNDDWEKTNTISFYLNNQYYGIPKNINNSIELEKELKTNNIKYYFVWGNSSSIHLFGYKEITKGKIEGLKIYEL